MLVATHLKPNDPEIDLSDPQIYNGNDNCRTFGILEKLLNLPQNNSPIYDLSRALQGPCMEMMLRGFLVDPMERDRAITDITERLKGINSALARLVHAISGQTEGFDKRPYFYNSAQQIKHLFYDVMGMKPYEKHNRGEKKLPMDEETLDKIKVHYPKARIIAAAILACRDLTKQKEKLEMEIDPDWRIRTSINIAGTNEGRFSNSKSFTGTGGNLQNIDERLRRIFIADPGYKLYGVDKEQAESRWVGLNLGILFDDWKYLNQLESGDGHTAIARMVWENDLPWTGDLKLDRQIADKPFAKDSYRQSCKILAHATAILGKPPTISIHTGIPVRLVEDFQDKYFSAFPAFPKYFNWLTYQIQSKQRLTTIFGRTRDFFGHSNSDDTIRKAAAFMQASPNADDTNLGLYKLWKIGGSRIQLLTQEHDAIYFQAKEDEDEKEIISLVKDCLINIIPLTPEREFYVPIDIKTGWNKGLRWKTEKDGTKTEVNPRGLDKPGIKR